jgi:predicted RNase H-like nuclease (RuvC/YqgF family)
MSRNSVEDITDRLREICDELESGDTIVCNDCDDYCSSIEDLEENLEKQTKQAAKYEAVVRALQRMYDAEITGYGVEPAKQEVRRAFEKIEKSL